MTKKKQAAVLKRWTMLKLRVAAADERASEARRDRREFVRDHLLSHPLRDVVKAKLLARVRCGGALCCSAGKEFLVGVVDPIWAETINEWAYEALGCGSPPEIEYWSRELAAKLDRDDWSVNL